MENLTFLGLMCVLLTCDADDGIVKKTPSQPIATSTMPKLPAPPLTLTKQKWQADKEYNNQDSSIFVSADKQQAWADVPFDKKTLVEVRRSKGLHNPWGYGDGGGRLHKVYTYDHIFPVILPPRYLEDGHEWKSYYSFNLGSSSFFYVGLPSDKQADYVYEVSDDGKYHLKITISHTKNGKLLYAQRLALEEVINLNLGHMVVKPSEYQDQLNAVFAVMADQHGAEWGGGRYHFNGVALPDLHPTIHPDELHLEAGCAWKPLNRQNLYQWGKARIDFLGRTVKHAKTFCSDKLVAVAYMLETQKVIKGGRDVKTVMDDRLLINVFDRQILSPIVEGDFQEYLDSEITEKLVQGRISVQHIDLIKDDSTTYQVVATLSDGQVIKY